MPPELEIRFLGLEEEDAAAADEVAAARVSDGRMTYNEDRDRMGMPRYDFPEADMPMLKTARGVVFLDGASKLAPAGEMVGPVQGTPQADADADGILDAPHGPDTDTKGAANTGADDGGDDDREDAVKAELAAHQRWARRNPNPSRPFAFNVVTKADAPHLRFEPMVLFAGEQADAGPKAVEARTGDWPGWARDEATATRWAARLRRGLADAADCERIAEAWLAQELVKADEPDAATSQRYEQPAEDDSDWTLALAVAFLAAQGVAFTAPIAAALIGLWTEGWAIGAASANTVLNGHRVRFGWSIGDEAEARRTLTATMAEALDAFLDRNRSSIPSIADHRLQAFARVLSRAKATGMNAKQLAAALRDALADDAWARMVALTELTRASAQAARDTYTAEGITEWRWVTEPGACPVCLANEAAGTRIIGETWPDGSEMPPAHPHCRCSVMPA
jgi:SPP1 gp7 family putative phage head morphogenesis protein